MFIVLSIKINEIFQNFGNEKRNLVIE